jgi:hypothetical protein
VLDGFAGVEAVNSSIEGIGAVLEFHIGPGRHFCIGAKRCPDSIIIEVSETNLQKHGAVDHDKNNAVSAKKVSIFTNEPY